MKQRPREAKPFQPARRAKACTDIQVRQNSGSIGFQRAQVLEDDLGPNGTTTSYLRMTREVRAGSVGAIFVSQQSRLGRNADEWFGLLKLCVTHNVMLVVDCRTHNFRDRGDLLLASAP